MGLAVINQEVVGTVTSVCSTCLESVSATVIVSNGDVYLRKSCPTHGEEVVLESKGREFYHFGASVCRQILESNDSSDPLGPSCVALVEITDLCNLECPLCFAASGPRGSFMMSVDEFQQRLEAVVTRRGAIDILMISGGEPTLHPNIKEILSIAASSPDVKMVMLNTNRIALTRSSVILGGCAICRPATAPFRMMRRENSQILVPRLQA